jgi:hypothetical protein
MLMRAPAAVADVPPEEPPGMTAEQREKWQREQNEAKAQWYAEQHAHRARTGSGNRSSMLDTGAGVFVLALFAAAMALTSRRRIRQARLE